MGSNGDGTIDGTGDKSVVTECPSINCHPKASWGIGDFTCTICTTDCTCSFSTKSADVGGEDVGGKDGSDAVVKKQPSRNETMKYKPQKIANSNVDSPPAPSTNTSEASKPAANTSEIGKKASNKISPSSAKSVHFDPLNNKAENNISSEFSSYDRILHDTPSKPTKYKGK